MAEGTATASIPYVQINRQFEDEQTELEGVIRDVLTHRAYVADELIDELERDVAAYCGVRHAVALNSGTDALMFGMVAAGIRRGDEVITPPNSFVASTSSIVHIGARPAFADVLPDQNIDPASIEAAITPNTRAIMAVHLTGRVARMDIIQGIADAHGLMVVEDAAQAMGSAYLGRRAGSFGRFAAFSTHPLKNLNGCGDGGLLTTDDDEIATRVRRLRNHGMADRSTVVEWGFVSRMDTIQAAILKYRLERLQAVIDRRRENARYYQEQLSHPRVFVPIDRVEEYNTFHTFVIQVDDRDGLKAHLADRGISTAIHYPIPIHLQPAAASLGYVRGDFPVVEQQAERILTLPVNQYVTRADQDLIIAEIHRYYAR